MSGIKNLTITTLSAEDTNDMFEAICKKITGETSLNTKKQVLGLEGDNKALEAHKVTLNELLVVIAFYDIETHLKVLYVEKEIKKTEPVKADMNAGLKQTEGSKAMDEQKALMKKDNTKVDESLIPPTFLD